MALDLDRLTWALRTMAENRSVEVVVDVIRNLDQLEDPATVNLLRALMAYVDSRIDAEIDDAHRLGPKSDT